MTADAVDDAWMEECLIAISKTGGSDLNFSALTNTVDFNPGDKDIEGIPLTNGGRVTKWSPEGDSEITFEAYPLQAGTDTGATGLGYSDLMHDVDAAVPIRVINSRTRDKYRVLVLWTNDSTATTAQSTTAEDASALRIGLADGHFTSAKYSFTDGILKLTATFKCTAFDKAAVGNILVESCAGSTALDKLPAIASYTSSCKYD